MAAFKRIKSKESKKIALVVFIKQNVASQVPELTKKEVKQQLRKKKAGTTPLPHYSKRR